MPNPKLMCIAGARPNFVKIAPILKAFEQSKSKITIQFIHTGQHYDSDLDTSFFQALEIRQPDENLDVRSGSHAEQTALIMQRFEPVVDKYQPDAILVVGDVNSTLACGLVAVKKQIPVIHVEAGLRSFDETMPEEINRRLTDQLSRLLFTTEKSGLKNLVNEGIEKSRIHFVGNVMIDSLLTCLPRVPQSDKILTQQLNLDKQLAQNYGVVTLHRPSNVDDPVSLENILQALQKISANIPLVFPVHPRTMQKLQRFQLTHYLNETRLIHSKPLGYLEMLSLMKDAKIVLTDSGGIQEETTVLKVPCLTLRENTERPITIEKGSNHLVGTNRDAIIRCAEKVLTQKTVIRTVPSLWDGKASLRIVEIIDNWLHESFIPEKERKIA